MTEEVARAMKISRKNSHMTIYDAAEMLGIDDRTLCRYESANPRETIKREDPSVIARAMELYGVYGAVIGTAYLATNPIAIKLSNIIIENTNAATGGSGCKSCSYRTAQ